jgi:hypothetical protein
MVEVTGPGAAAAHGVLPSGGAGVSLHGVPAPAQVTGEDAKAHALVQQVVDKAMVNPVTFGPQTGRRPYYRSCFGDGPK